MVVVITGLTKEAALIDLDHSWKTYDPEPDSELVIFDGKIGDRQEKVFVRIALIDWASKIEVKGFVIDATARIEPSEARPSQQVGDEQRVPQILVVGDSISSGLAVPVEEGGELIPFGCLSMFPFVAQRILQARASRNVVMELIGCPGFCLVHPTETEKSDGFRNGMLEAFFWDSPWDSERPSLHTSSPIAVLIELGTNDQCFNLEPKRFGDALVLFVESLKKWSKNSIRHLWIVPPFPDADVDYRDINIAMPGYLSSLKEKFGDEIDVKICDLVDNLGTKDTVDGVHPTLLVHNNLGQQLADFIDRSLFEGDTSKV